MAGQDQVQSAYGQGTSAINSFNPQDVSGKTQSGYDSLFGKQQGQTNDFIQSYKNQIASQPSATDYYQKGNEQYNVPQLAQNANYLQNQVTNQLPMVQSMARGFDVNQHQVDNQVNQNLRYLQPQATAATNQLQTAQGLAAGYASAGQAQNQMNLLPTQQQGSMMNDLFARQATGFGQAQQQQYEGLVAKMQAGVQLSTAEMQQLAQLAQAQQAYDAQVKSAQIGATANIDAAKIGAQNVALSPGSTYLNTATGKAYNPFASVR